MAATLVFSSPCDDFEHWRALLAARLPGVQVCLPEQVRHPEQVLYALVWSPPSGFFARYPNLRLVVNLGAGVDALVARDDLPAAPITRLADPAMTRMMGSYVLFAVLRYARGIPALEQAQRERRWAYAHPPLPHTLRVGILGLGELGSHAALELVRQGFSVQGWARSPKQLDGVACHHGEAALPGFLASTDILVVMLPLTPQTHGLLDAERLAWLPAGACLINVARGQVLDQAALTAALASRRLAHATLDVFSTEPLPPSDPLWAMGNVLITPHVASMALPATAVVHIAENIARLQRGEPVLHQVDPTRGY